MNTQEIQDAIDNKHDLAVVGHSFVRDGTIGQPMGFDKSGNEVMLRFPIWNITENIKVPGYPRRPDLLLSHRAVDWLLGDAYWLFVDKKHLRTI